MTILYNLFVKHNVLPHEFYGVPTSDIARKIIKVFSNYEIEQENKAAEKARKGAK